MKNACKKNTCPGPDPKGPRTPSLPQTVKYGGNKPNGEKNSSDGKGHYCGH